MAPALDTATTWVATWDEVAEGVWGMNGSRALRVAELPAPLPAGVELPVLSRAQASALGAAWQSYADAAGIDWAPPALPAGPPAAELDAATAAAWWASTYALARDLDAAGVPVEPYHAALPPASTPAAAAKQEHVVLALAVILTAYALVRRGRRRKEQ